MPKTFEQVMTNFKDPIGQVRVALEVNQVFLENSSNKDYQSFIVDAARRIIKTVVQEQDLDVAVTLSIYLSSIFDAGYVLGREVGRSEGNE